MSVEGDLQHSLRMGDAVLLYAKDARGYVFSELSGSQHNSVAVTPRGSFKDPNFTNVHIATFCVVAANKNKAQERLLELKKMIGSRDKTTQERGVLHQAHKDVEAELRDNAAEQERVLGTSLVYGESVQLQHTLSKKYMTVNTTLTSRTENTSLRVELTTANTAGCVFKILPRYKVRSVGDVVRYNDQVKFESVKTEGQFLHCSLRPCGAVGFHVLEYNHELNLSATESALTIIPHYRPLTSYNPKTFRAGQSVRLFHREYECYISAEGSFAEYPVVVEDVHCRKRKTDHGLLKAPSTSSNTFWQIEKEGDPRSGEPLSWGERCRIRHMPTRRYLAVVDNGRGECKVILKERQSVGHAAPGQDLETVFSLSPVIQEGDTIVFESYARIKHLATRTWLHLDKSQSYKRQAFDPTAPGLKGLEWDSAELFMLAASETMNYDDAFTLEMVSEPLLNKFNFVAGIVPVLSTHLAQRGLPDAPPLYSQDAFFVASALEDLARYISGSSNERETKDRQKLLRNLRILEMIISILGLFDPDARDSSQQRKVCQACYHVIESYLKGDSRKNENYLARFIDFFQTQVGMDLNAEEVMIEMVEDNTAIVSKMAASEIDFMLQRLVETRDPRFLQFLSNLCVCNERPIPSTQNTILDKLVKPHGKSVFFRLEVGGSDFLPEGEGGVVYYQRPGSSQWRPLLDIASKDCESDDFEFLDSQLLLFGKMCKGNNEQCINALDKEGLRYVTFQQALWCVRCTDLHPSIASKYVELIKVMFVDVGENRAVLENLSLSFIYEDVVENPYEDTGSDDITALTGVANEYFPDMRDWILDYLTIVMNQSVIARNKDKNHLLARVLEVLSLLVKYGYYDDPEDVDAVLKPLVDIMNGFTDLPFALTSPSRGGNSSAVKRQLDDFRSGGRFKENEENQAIFNVKEKAIEVIDLLFNFRLYVRLQRFIFDFRMLRGDAGPQPGATPSGRGLLSTVTSATRPPLLLQSLFTDGKELLRNPVLINTARERLKFLFSKSAYFFEGSEYANLDSTPFTEILVDMSRYHNDELVQGSLHLLNRFFSSETSLFHSSVQTQLLLTEESKRMFKEIGNLLPTLRRLLSVDLGEASRAEVVDILRTFIGLCQLSVEEAEPHTQNQKILYNFGVLSDILNYVLEPANVIQRESTPGPDMDDSKTTAFSEMVYVKCFQFLKVFARRNLEVQRRLYERMNDLLDIEVAVAHMAEVLTEVFTGGPEIALRVKEEQVERIFQLVSARGSGQVELMETLQSMAKVEDLDLPIKRNQAFIIKFFSKSREKFCDHLFGEDKKSVRWELLTEAREADRDLQLLMAVTDLLASCAEGENLFIESVCQTIYKVEELLEILSHPRLSPERKRPFARFLIWVYLNTEGDKYQSGASSLSSSASMWAYLEHLSTLLENIGIALRAIPDTEHEWVRVGLSTRSRTTSMSMRGKKRAVRTTSRSIEYVTTDGGELKPGVLLYFVDGVLPMLRSFFANFFSPPKEGEDRNFQLKVTDSLLSNLLQLCDTLMLYFTTSGQVKLYRSTVVTLLQLPTPSLETSEVVQMIGNFDARTKHSSGAAIPAQERYEAEYSEELRLNTEFNQFVANFRLAYQGPNTARAQIGAKYDTDYSDFLDEDYSLPGDEYLPLGPSFQEHVALFVRRREGSGVLGGGLPMAPFMQGGSGESEVLRSETARLVTQLEISFKKLKELDDTERQRQDELDVKTLRILRAVVHNEIMNIDPQLREDDPTAFRRRCAARLHPVQNKLQGFGNVVSRVVPLLSHPNDEVVCEVLAFIKVMLYSGNRTVQRGFEHLLQTREERLFTTMKNLLQHAAVTYNERRALLAQVSSRMAMEESLLQAFDESRRAEGTGSPKFKETASVTIEFTSMTTEDKNGEYVPLQSLGPGSRPLLGGDEDVEEEEDGVPLVSAQSGKKARGGPQRRRKSTKPVLDLDFGTMRTVRREGSADEVYDPYAGIDEETVEMLKFQDSAHIKLALKVLGLMCDGQYRLMQNYLREQRDNIVTINIVGEVALFAQHFYTDINKETMELMHLILQTLIESCVGNFPNQEVIYNRQIVDVLNAILQLYIGDHEKYGYTIEDSVNLKGSAVELIEAMLEETSPQTHHLAKEIAGSLDLAAIYDSIGDFYELMNDREVQRAGFDDEAERGLFRAYHILVHLQDYGNNLGTWAEPPEDDETVCSAYKFCQSHSKSIEINYQNMEGEKILTKVNFQFDPANELREEVVENVKWQVNRDSAEDKLRDFLEWMYAVKKDTLHHKWLHSHWPTRLLIMLPAQRYYLLLFLTFLLNFFVLITFHVPDDLRNLSPDNATWPDTAGAIKPDVMTYFRKYLLFILGAFHLVFTVWMIIEYFVLNYPNFIFPLPAFCYTLFKRFGLKEPERTYSSITVYGLRTMYMVIFLLASVFSLAFWGYFYALCMLHIIINNDILQRVLRSITKNGVALLWVAALGGVVLYIYAVISFAFMHESYYEGQDAALYCDTLGQCFISVIRWGLIDNLGLVVPLVPEEFKTSGLRILFDISFFIIVTTIGLNIVFGIIVDTFSELRDERFRTEQDKKSFCFICSLPNHEFERRAEGFDHHVKRDHNMWIYIYYSVYLDTIDVSDHNAIEKFVYEMVSEGKIEFFPLLQALCLDTEEDDTAQQLESLRTMVTSVLDRFKEEEHEKTQRSKRQEQEKWEEKVLKGRGSIFSAPSVEETPSITIPFTH